MLDKFKYNIFESGIPGNIYVKSKVSVLCQTVAEIWKSKLFTLDSGLFENCKKKMEAPKSQIASINILK